MPKIQAVASANPETRVDQGMAAEFARAQFADHLPDIESLMPLFENTGIHTRYFAVPPGVVFHRTRSG